MRSVEALFPTQSERLARARADLRAGVSVRLTGQTSVLITPVETLDAARLKALRTLDPSLTIAITHWRADVLKARAYDGDIARIALPADVDLAWIRAIADPARDLDAPMKGPLQSFRDGDADPHRAALAIVKAAHLLPSALVAAADSLSPEETHAFTTLSLDDVAKAENARLEDVVCARLPITVSPNTRLHVFRPTDGGEEHYAIEVGRVDRERPVLTRLHSACYTGDVLGSLKGDCGPQLSAALEQMAAGDGGILLYLNQEGRGIGLTNKMRAYRLQNQGFDTVEANHRLGFEDDERDFRLGAALLKLLNVPSVRLLTNNPNKVTRLEEQGIAVSERVPLKVGENRFNAEYLATKAAKSGHFL